MATWARQFYIEVERDAPFIDDNNAVCERNGLRDIVGDEDGCKFLLAPDAFQKKLHFDAGERIERTERLIQRQYLRMGDKGACQGHALLLAAGEDVGPFPCPVLQADLFKNGKRLLLRRFAFGDASQPNGNIACDPLPRQQARLLKHHAGSAGCILRHGSGRRRVEARQNAQKRAFAAAALADDGQKLAFPHIEIDAAQNGFIAKTLRDVSKTEGNLAFVQFGAFHNPRFGSGWKGLRSVGASQRRHITVRHGLPQAFLKAGCHCRKTLSRKRAKLSASLPRSA
ncbi:Hypothetical protein AT6N2_L0492 [Agrobacterium tumefaciens]|nr:Hypothetical protein AT6N2_L0492 [Agrobacterium tumefaciens]